MKTFAFTFLILCGLFMIWWLWTMLAVKPKTKYNTRFSGNWVEGGKILLIMGLGLILGLSLAVTEIILKFNFLEKFTH